MDHETLTTFEKDLKGNLYKVWNRMSSGSYFPPPVRLVEIPKKSGGMRPLGIPTIADRVAQAVAKMVLEPLVEPAFHQDSYGYRRGRSALDAVGVARQRCWKADWIIDLGPGGGAQGGHIVCAGTPKQVARCTESHTGQFLAPLLKK